MSQTRDLKEPVYIHPSLLPVVAAALINRIDRGMWPSESSEMIPLFKEALNGKTINQGMPVTKKSVAYQIAESLSQYLINFHSETDKLATSVWLIATSMDTHLHADKADIERLVITLTTSLNADQPIKTLEIKDPELPMLLAAAIHQLQEVIRDSEGDTPLARGLRGLISGLQGSRDAGQPFIIRDRPTALRLHTALGSYLAALHCFGEDTQVAMRMISCDMERLPYPTEDDLWSLRKKLNNYAAEMDL